MVEYAIGRYEGLLSRLEPFPRWHEKAVDEIGYLVNFLHSIHKNDGGLEELLKDFNKHEFFK